MPCLCLSLVDCSGCAKEKILHRQDRTYRWRVRGIFLAQSLSSDWDSLIKHSVSNRLKLKPGSEIYVKNRPSWMSSSEDVAQFEDSRK